MSNPFKKQKLFHTSEVTNEGTSKGQEVITCDACIDNTPFPFLDLPFDLQYHIYHFLLSVEDRGRLNVALPKYNNNST